MRYLFCLVVLLTAFAVAGRTASAQTAAPFDVVIVNGHIIDGTGSPWYSGQIGIRGGHIAAIGNLGAAPRKQTIDAQGQGGCAGVHRHAGPVGDDDAGRSAAAVEDLPGHHD